MKMNIEINTIPKNTTNIYRKINVDEHSLPRSKKPPIFCKFQTLLLSQVLATSKYDNESTWQQLLHHQHLSRQRQYSTYPPVDLSRRY